MNLVESNGLKLSGWLKLFSFTANTQDRQEQVSIFETFISDFGSSFVDFLCDAR